MKGLPFFLVAAIALSGCERVQVEPGGDRRVPPNDDLEHITLVESPTAYMAWPAIARVGDGSILVTYSDTDEHLGPDGRIVGVRSLDEGRTWSEPFVIYDTPLDDREGGVTTLSDGSLAVHLWSTRHTRESYERLAPGSYFDETIQGWIETVESSEYRNAADFEGGRVARSTDGGITWSEVVRGPDTVHGGVELADGSILVSSYRHSRDYVTIQRADRWDGPWEQIAEVHSPEPESLSFGEPSILQLPSGRLIMMMRVTPEPYSNSDDRSVLWEAYSDDGGHSWSDPFPTPLWGFPPHLTLLKDGRVVVVYGYRRPPYGQRAAVSQDGITWRKEDEVVLRDDGPNEDLGYPASVELKDGSVLTVYYQSHVTDTLRPTEGPPPDRHKPDILGTIWRP